MYPGNGRQLIFSSHGTTSIYNLSANEDSGSQSKPKSVSRGKSTSKSTRQKLKLKKSSRSRSKPKRSKSNSQGSSILEKPGSAKPGAIGGTKPGNAKPEAASKSGNPKPGGAKPGSTKPGGSKPGMSRAGSAKPSRSASTGGVKPGSSKPGGTKPSGRTSGSAKPGSIAKPIAKPSRHESVNSLSSISRPASTRHKPITKQKPRIDSRSSMSSVLSKPSHQSKITRNDSNASVSSATLAKPYHKPTSSSQKPTRFSKDKQSLNSYSKKHSKSQSMNRSTSRVSQTSDEFSFEDKISVGDSEFSFESIRSTPTRPSVNSKPKSKSIIPSQMSKPSSKPLSKPLSKPKSKLSGSASPQYSSASKPNIIPPSASKELKLPNDNVPLMLGRPESARVSDKIPPLQGSEKPGLGRPESVPDSAPSVLSGSPESALQFKVRAESDMESNELERIHTPAENEAVLLAPPQEKPVPHDRVSISDHHSEGIPRSNRISSRCQAQPHIRSLSTGIPVGYEQAELQIIKNLHQQQKKDLDDVTNSDPPGDSVLTSHIDHDSEEQVDNPQLKNPSQHIRTPSQPKVCDLAEVNFRTPSLSEYSRDAITSSSVKSPNTVSPIRAIESTKCVQGIPEIFPTKVMTPVQTKFTDENPSSSDSIKQIQSPHCLQSQKTEEKMIDFEIPLSTEIPVNDPTTQIDVIKIPSSNDCLKVEQLPETMESRSINEANVNFQIGTVEEADLIEQPIDIEPDENPSSKDSVKEIKSPEIVDGKQTDTLDINFEIPSTEPLPPIKPSEVVLIEENPLVQSSITKEQAPMNLIDREIDPISLSVDVPILSVSIQDATPTEVYSAESAALNSPASISVSSSVFSPSESISLTGPAIPRYSRVTSLLDTATVRDSMICRKGSALNHIEDLEGMLPEIQSLGNGRLSIELDVEDFPVELDMNTPLNTPSARLQLNEASDKTRASFQFPTDIARIDIEEVKDPIDDVRGEGEAELEPRKINSFESLSSNTISEHTRREFMTQDSMMMVRAKHRHSQSKGIRADNSDGFGDVEAHPMRKFQRLIPKESSHAESDQIQLDDVELTSPRKSSNPMQGAEIDQSHSQDRSNPEDPEMVHRISDSIAKAAQSEEFIPFDPIRDQEISDKISDPKEEIVVNNEGLVNTDIVDSKEVGEKSEISEPSGPKESGGTVSEASHKNQSENILYFENSEKSVGKTDVEEMKVAVSNVEGRRHEIPGTIPRQLSCPVQRELDEDHVITDASTTTEKELSAVEESDTCDRSMAYMKSNFDDRRFSRSINYEKSDRTPSVHNNNLDSQSSSASLNRYRYGMTPQQLRAEHPAPWSSSSVLVMPPSLTHATTEDDGGGIKLHRDISAPISRSVSRENSPTDAFKRNYSRFSGRHDASEFVEPVHTKRNVSRERFPEESDKGLEPMDKAFSREYSNPYSDPPSRRTSMSLLNTPSLFQDRSLRIIDDNENLIPDNCTQNFKKRFTSPAPSRSEAHPIIGDTNPNLIKERSLDRDCDTDFIDMKNGTSCESRSISDNPHTTGMTTSSSLSNFANVSGKISLATSLMNDRAPEPSKTPNCTPTADPSAWQPDLNINNEMFEGTVEDGGTQDPLNFAPYSSNSYPSVPKCDEAEPVKLDSQPEKIQSNGSDFSDDFVANKQSFDIEKVRNSILVHKTAITVKRATSLPAIGENEVGGDDLTTPESFKTKNAKRNSSHKKTISFHIPADVEEIKANFLAGFEEDNPLPDIQEEEEILPGGRQTSLQSRLSAVKSTYTDLGESMDCGPSYSDDTVVSKPSVPKQRSRSLPYTPAPTGDQDFMRIHSDFEVQASHDRQTSLDEGFFDPKTAILEPYIEEEHVPVTVTPHEASLDDQFFATPAAVPRNSKPVENEDEPIHNVRSKHDSESSIHSSNTGLQPLSINGVERGTFAISPTRRSENALSASFLFDRSGSAKRESQSRQRRSFPLKLNLDTPERKSFGMRMQRDSIRPNQYAPLLAGSQSSLLSEGPLSSLYCQDLSDVPEEATDEYVFGKDDEFETSQSWNKLRSNEESLQKLTSTATNASGKESAFIYSKSTSRDQEPIVSRMKSAQSGGHRSNDSTSSVQEILRDYAEERSSILSSQPPIARSDWSEESMTKENSAAVLLPRMGTEPRMSAIKETEILVEPVGMQLLAASFQKPERIGPAVLESSFMTTECASLTIKTSAEPELIMSQIRHEEIRRKRASLSINHCRMTTITPLIERREVVLQPCSQEIVNIKSTLRLADEHRHSSLKKVIAQSEKAHKRVMTADSVNYRSALRKKRRPLRSQTVGSFSYQSRLSRIDFDLNQDENCESPSESSKHEQKVHSVEPLTTTPRNSVQANTYVHRLFSDPSEKMGKLG